MNNLNRIHTSTVLRVVAFFGLLSLIGIAATVVQQPQNLMYNTDLPGLDYKKFNMRADISVPEHRCAQSCREDEKCQAWTLVKPPHQGPLYVCYHKSAIPEKVDNQTCCISGVPHKRIEENVDRPGNDYRTIDFSLIRSQLGEPPINPVAVCLHACEGDRKCNAWTYVPAGLNGRKGVCWLKSGGVPAARSSTGMTSGVIIGR